MDWRRTMLPHWFYWIGLIVSIIVGFIAVCQLAPDPSGAENPNSRYHQAYLNRRREVDRAGDFRSFQRRQRVWLGLSAVGIVGSLWEIFR